VDLAIKSFKNRLELLPRFTELRCWSRWRHWVLDFLPKLLVSVVML